MFVRLGPAAVCHCVGGSIYCELTIFFPLFRQTQQFCRRHFNEGKHLAALYDQRIIIRPDNAERAPKPHPLQLVEPAFNFESIAESGRAPIIDLSTYYHGILFVFVHLRESQTEFFSEQRPSDLDETEISD